MGDIHGFKTINVPFFGLGVRRRGECLTGGRGRRTLGRGTPPFAFHSGDPAVPFWKKKPKASSPTDVVQSSTAPFLSSVMGSKTLDVKTKGFLAAALNCVGNFSHGKCYIPEFNNWEQGNPDAYLTPHEKGLNCWTSVLFWAFQGGALPRDQLVGYLSELRAVKSDDPGELNQQQNVIMYSFMRANQATDITEDDQPDPGLLVYFGDTLWKRPLNHVVASLGGGYCVSSQSLFVGVKGSVVTEIAKLNPTIPQMALFNGLIHISTIKLIANGGDDAPRIRVSPAPFWELPRLPWTS